MSGRSARATALGTGVAAALALAAVFGTLQAVSTIAVRRSAAPLAWVRLVPVSAARAVDGLDPAWPLPPALRLVLARSAIARGDDAAAAAHAARMPNSRDRFAILGALALHRGDLAGAARDALAAGDLAALERGVDAEAAAGHGDRALRLQRATIARLGADRADGDALAEAYFRLGLLSQTLAYRRPIADRAPGQRASFDAYRRAVALAPLSSRYVLGAASEALNVGDLSAAAALFERARAADPTSADAFAGLGEVALRRGDLRGAADALARAGRIDAASPAVLRLARELRG